MCFLPPSAIDVIDVIDVKLTCSLLGGLHLVPTVCAVFWCFAVLYKMHFKSLCRLPAVLGYKYTLTVCMSCSEVLIKAYTFVFVLHNIMTGLNGAAQLFMAWQSLQS